MFVIICFHSTPYCTVVGVAKLLLQYGANINTHSNEFKESALTLACYKGHLEMVKFLLSAGKCNDKVVCVCVLPRVTLVILYKAFVYSGCVCLYTVTLSLSLSLSLFLFCRS